MRRDATFRQSRRSFRTASPNAFDILVSASSPMPYTFRSRGVSPRPPQTTAVVPQINRQNADAMAAGVVDETAGDQSPRLGIEQGPGKRRANFLSPRLVDETERRRRWLLTVPAE